MTPLKLAARHISQDPRDPAFAQNPYALYSRMHQLGGPVYWADYDLWCLSEFDAVNAALRDKRFARRCPADLAQTSPADHMQDFARAEAHSLLALEPPSHTRLRQRVNRAFVTRQVSQMEADIAALANQRIDSFIDRGEVELLQHYATAIPVTVIARLLGVPEAMGEQLLAWSHAMVQVYTLTQTRAEEIQANRAAAEFQDYLQTLIDHKRRHPANDLLSHLMGVAGDSDRLQDDEIISVAILLLNAGHEATVHQLGNAVKTLLESALPTTAWLDNTDHANAVVAEAMRFDAPLHLFTRYAQQDVDLGEGVVIARGEQVALLLAAANRDPRKFHHAECFEPRRADANHLALGAGLHFCVGAQLAKLELRVSLQTLFRRIPQLALAESPRYQNSFHFHGLESLNLRW